MIYITSNARLSNWNRLFKTTKEYKTSTNQNIPSNNFNTKSI